MKRATWRLTVLLLAAACSGGGNGDPPPSAQPRPSSPALIAIDVPSNADVVKGPKVRLVIRLEGATLVDQPSATPSPTEGMLLVTLDRGQPIPGKLEMTLEGVSPGEHVVQAEFVAADGKSFNPRVDTAVSFTVQ